MASYTELLTVIDGAGSQTLRDKIKFACVVAAELIRLEGDNVPHKGKRLAWARDTLNDPAAMATKMVWAIAAQNRAATLNQINAADDATVQTAVNNAVNLLAGV